MPEAAVLLLALLTLGAFVLAPLRRPAVGVPVVTERDAAAVRHRVALEGLRDVEADRRAGSLDERGYAEQLAEAEARAAETAAELEATQDRPAEPPPARIGPAVVVAAVVGLVVVAGSLVPAAGLGNSTVIDEDLAAQREVEAAREADIERLLDSLATDPEDAETLSDLADAYLAGSTLDDLRRAVAALQVLIALQPERADAYERIITAYLRAGAYEDGRNALESYADIDSADATELAFFDGLIALNGENDPDRAIEAFDLFLELAPDDPRAPMVRGLLREAEAAASGS